MRRKRSSPGISTALVVAVVLVLLLPAHAGARPEATFVSKLYHYSLVLPGGAGRWFVRPASVSWSSGAIDHTSPEFDLLTDLDSGRFYFLAAETTDGGLRGWTETVASERPAVCGTARPVGASTLGGARARILTWTCADGYRVFAAAALHRHRGYVMLVASLTTLPRASDRLAFDRVRRSFRFR